MIMQRGQIRRKSTGVQMLSSDIIVAPQFGKG
jgi:hypothetical protein